MLLIFTFMYLFSNVCYLLFVLFFFRVLIVVVFQSESQDQVFLRWTTGETATMHILVVHAMVILLTLGPPKGRWSHVYIESL